jgi:signal transduction histidine kinase
MLQSISSLVLRHDIQQVEGPRGMFDTSTPEPAAAWLSPRLQQARHELAQRWRARADPQLPDLIGAVADYLRLPPERDITADTAVMRQAGELGRRRFAQGATASQLLDEYQHLADLVEEFLVEQARAAERPFADDDVVRAVRRATHTVRALQQRSIDAFVQQYTDTISRQSEQLVAFGRLVAHEMRQPIGVLQVMADVFPLREGDFEGARLMDVFDRNVRRLADVAFRLERLSHDGLEQAEPASGPTIDLNELVAEIALKLDDMSKGRDVRVLIGAGLPVLRADAARTEMIFVALIANAIKYADPDKPARLVEVLSVPNRSQPTVIVRDNGIGMPRYRIQHFFREFSRLHPHRERDVRDQGFGLGLSVVRDSMDACGGTVLLQSTEGVGTTVTLSWPPRARPAAR